jgi:hypothetical protein
MLKHYHCINLSTYEMTKKNHKIKSKIYKDMKNLCLYNDMHLHSKLIYFITLDQYIYSEDLIPDETRNLISINLTP